MRDTLVSLFSQKRIEKFGVFKKLNSKRGFLFIYSIKLSAGRCRKSFTRSCCLFVFEEQHRIFSVAPSEHRLEKYIYIYKISLDAVLPDKICNDGSFFKVRKSMISFSLKNAMDTLLPNGYLRIKLAPDKLIIMFPCSVVDD